MIKFVAIFVITFCISSTYAQHVDSFKLTGIVVSALTGKPIPYGSIMKSKTSGTQCDSLGRFTIFNLPKGVNKLFFSWLGYDNTDTTIIINNEVSDFKFIVSTDCNVRANKNKALQDIKEGKPKLLLASGDAPIVYKSDKLFSDKYQVYFYDYGCLPDRQECMIQYNKCIFEYLDNKFGKAWRKEVRKDIIGLKSR